MPWTAGTRYLQMTGGSVELRNPDGSVVWSAPVSSVLEPDLVAEGDMTGDGVPDFIVEEVRTASPAQYCVGHLMSETQLVFIDGASGQSWRPVQPMLDLCWAAYGYATHQWGVGSAYIGPFEPGRAGNDVVLFPYWAQAGFVLRFDRRRGWVRVEGVRQEIPYPSTPAFDDAYNATNGSSCAALPDSDHCWVKYSHVANGVFVGGHGSPSGLLVLTTNRAVIYRTDFTPTSDFVWNYAEGGGRNYGLVESHAAGAGQMVTLIGGCSVSKSRDDMRTGQLSRDGCGLFHHYEYFFVQDQKIVQHDGVSFGWAGTDGLWQNRLEFPFPSRVALTPGATWSVFNLYHDGQWRAELMPDPADPAGAIEVPGWFVWGAVTDRFGHALLVATRTAATSTTSTSSYVPAWEFDFLRWQNGSLVSVAHRDGVAPSLVLYPPASAYHVSDGDTFGLAQKYPSGGRGNQIMVETLSGDQSWMAVPDARIA